MKCPKCKFKNPEGIKFCGECGAKLDRVCPSCKSSSPPNFKFCGECGHKLEIPVESYPKDLSFDEKLDRIQRYLPKGLAEKILAQKNKIEGEHKQVTVMFCDMEGYSQLSERLGIEEAYEIMDQVYEILIHKVHDYDGTVNEMTGDGIMALFGAPIALEDAPQRAIRSAMAIHREMARFSQKIKEERKENPTLKMRAGIHTGPVVVGTLGNDLRVEFKAVGETVNLSSRMEGLAESGTTYVTEDTFKLTEGFFRFEALGEKQVKGRKKPIGVYRVIGASTRRTRFDVSAEAGLTPFVGRERELELLLDGFERSKNGRGQAFSIISEAGLGKSRLLYEFRKAITNENVTFLEGKCLSYSRGSAYHPVIDKPHKSNLSAVPAIYPLTALAEVYHLKGQTEKAIHNIEIAFDIFKQKGERGFGAWALYYMAKIQSQGGSEQMQQAAHSYLQAKRQAAELGMRPLLTHCHMGLGEIYIKKGKTSDANSELSTAMDLYRSTGMDHWMPQVKSAFEMIT